MIERPFMPVHPMSSLLILGAGVLTITCLPQASIGVVKPPGKG
jgi:hypothetical protein